METYMQNVHEIINGQTTFGALLFYVISVIALWKVFNKAGESGIWAFIPIVNLYKLCKIADGNGWKFLLFIVPIVNVVYAFLLNIRMAKSFGKSTLFGIGLVFLNIIFTYILGFGTAQYIGPKGQRR